MACRDWRLFEVAELREYVEYYAGLLAGPSSEDAWHCLVEAGPTALPLLMESFQAVQNSEVRELLLSVIVQHPVPTTAPFLVNLFDSDAPEIWKTALDGLVSVGGSKVAAMIRGCKAATDPQKREWFEEALEDVEEAPDQLPDSC